jgi:hypothetical protein
MSTKILPAAGTEPAKIETPIDCIRHGFALIDAVIHLEQARPVRAVVMND